MKVIVKKPEWKFLSVVFLLFMVTHEFASASTIWDEPPPFDLADLQGKQHQLSDWKGHVMVINFWGNNNGFIPYTVVILKSGEVKFVHRGKLGQPEFDEYVWPLLQIKAEQTVVRADNTGLH